MGSQVLIEEYKNTGLALCESKWSHYGDRDEQKAFFRRIDKPVNFMEGLESDWDIATMAILLENTEKFINNLEETTRAVAIGDFQKYAFPLVRAIFPELVAQSIVSVQPMLGPTSLVFYLDFVFGSTKGSITKGTTSFDSVALGANNQYYSSPVVDSEAVGTAGSTSYANLNLSYIPVIPGTVKFTDGTLVVVDNGNGGFAGDIAGGGSINYATGAYTVVFSGTTSGNVTVSYEYDMEGNSNIPEVDLVLSSSPVVARPRKLRTRWSLESAFNLRSLHGLDAEVELTAAVGSEIRFEIDREIISDIVRIVPTANVVTNWSKSRVFPANSTPDTVSYTEHKLSIIDAFVEGGNRIFQSTGRGTAVWMVCAVTVMNVIETLPGWVPVPNMPNGLIKGVHRAGTLNGRWDVYKDPFFTADTYIMGYKGTSFLEAGYIYAPYVPLYTTPTIVLDDFVGRKGLATQYGKKVVNNRFYAKGAIVAVS